MKRLLVGVMLFFSCGLALAAEPATRTIVLVRHGHYDADPGADPKLGPRLSSLGVAQAARVGARLAGMPGRFDALHVSPFQRARDTAATIGAALPDQRFEVLEDLRECMPPSRDARMTKSEKPEDLAACRVQFDRLFTTLFRPAEGAARTELHVAHSGVIRYLVARALGMDETNWAAMSIGHASITRIRIEADGSIKVIAIGDVGHVPPNLQTGASGDRERSLQVVPLSQ